MFYIVESEDQLQHLSNLGKQGGFVHVISNNYQLHPSLSTIVAVYIRPLEHKQGYIIPVSHDEGLNVDLNRVCQVLSSYDTLYTLDKKALLYYCNIQRAIDIQLLYSMTELILKVG